MALMQGYTLFKKKCNIFEVAFLFGEECIPVNLELTKSSRPYVRVSDPGAAGKMGRLKLCFFIKKSVQHVQHECQTNLTIKNYVLSSCHLMAFGHR